MKDKFLKDLPIYLNGFAVGWLFFSIPNIQVIDIAMYILGIYYEEIEKDYIQMEKCYVMAIKQMTENNTLKDNYEIMERLSLYYKKTKTIRK